MSKTALVFLLLTATTFSAALLLPPQATTASDVLISVSVLTGMCSLVALVIGRRFRFDPLLR